MPKRTGPGVVLSPTDRENILRYAYKHEMEQMFTIGSFEGFVDAFAENTYIGIERGGELSALAVHFGRFKSLTTHAEDLKDIPALMDAMVERKLPITMIPCHRIYAEVMVKRLREHGMEPTNIVEDTFFHLPREEFKDPILPEGSQATIEDIDDIIHLEHMIDGNPLAPITEEERKQIFLKREWLIREGDLVVARANIHATSLHFAQIGGVMTHPLHRGKGLGKRMVSAVCRHIIAENRDPLLYCRNGNTPAWKIYEQLGFSPVAPFLSVAYGEEHASCGRSKNVERVAVSSSSHLPPLPALPLPLPIPFSANTSTGLQCFQCAMQSVIAYFLKKTIPLEELDILTNRRGNFWTWTPQAAAALHTFGLRVELFSLLEYARILREPTFLREWFKELVDHILTTTDLPALHQSIQTCITHKLIQHTPLSLDDLCTHLKNGHVPIVLVDANILRSIAAPFAGHAVVVTGYSDTHITYHESGPENPTPHRSVPRELFSKAWYAPGTDRDCVIVYGLADH